jgi:flagellar biosynthesis protein FlhG
MQHFGIVSPWKLRSDPRSQPTGGNPGGGLIKSSPTSIRNSDWLLGVEGDATIAAASNIPRIIAIGGGKGGVGKSFLSANLAAKLGGAGKKVVLVDFDLGGANLHTYFGMGVPKRCLADFGVADKWDLRDVLIPTPSNRVALVAGGRSEMWSDEPSSQFMDHLWRSLIAARQEFGADVIVLDLGAGVHRHTVDFFMRAHVGLVAVLPEPTSIENTYAFLKAGFMQLTEVVGRNSGRMTDGAALLRLISEGDGTASGQGSHLAKLRKFGESHPEFADLMMCALRGRWLGIVLNQSRSLKDVEIGKAMENICSSYFGYRANFLGHLNYDEVAWKALRNQRLLVTDFPHSQIAKKLSEMTSKIFELFDAVRD